MITALHAAQTYAARHWNPLPLPFKAKKPTDEGWQKRVITEADLPQHFNGREQNVGVIMGPSSRGLTDADLDCREAIELASHVLPKTSAIFGRASAPGSHRLYYSKLASTSEDANATIQFKDSARPAKEAMLLEIRVGGVKGAQTVFPGSVHESGEEIRWDENGDPAEVADDDLLKRAHLLASICLLARYWPGEGARHDAALSVGGFLARAGLKAPQIKYLVEAIARTAGDVEHQDRKNTAEDAAQQFHAGKPARGYPELKKTFGEGAAKQVAEWLGYSGSRSDDDTAESAESATLAELEILRLAKLPAIKYEQERKAAAEALNFRASTLDRLVEAERARLGFDDEDAAAPALYAHWNVEMTGEPIDGGILLRALKEAIRRYVFASDDQALVVALWIVFSWLHQHVTHSPILFVTSAERDSGKTTLLGVINFLARRSLQSVDISGAALFRSITKWEPTLIVDEADDALVDNVDLRSVINSGWTRGQGTIRCHPDTHEPELFSTFAPKVVAMKGRNLPDTTLSRSIIITMRPRRAGDPEEHAADFDHLDNETFARLRSQAMRWAADNGEVIALATPEIPSGFHNRRRANWKPLLAIAEACGWKTDGWKAALAIEAVADTFDPSLGVELLWAVKAAFKDVDRITSAALVKDLTEDETARWATYNKGKPVSQRQVASLLKPYGIKPKTIRLDDGSTPRGYLLEMFADVFDRFCSGTERSHPPNLSATSATDLFSQDFSRFRSATGGDDVADRKNEKPFDNNVVADVADENGGPGDAPVFCAYCSLLGGNEVAMNGRTARLHRDCEEPYWRFLDDNLEVPPADACGLLDGWAVAKGEHGEVRPRHPLVSFFGVEPFASCDQCGKTDGVVHHVGFNRYPGRPSLNLHEACIASWLAAHDEDAD